MIITKHKPAINGMITIMIRIMAWYDEGEVNKIAIYLLGNDLFHVEF